MTRHLLKEYIRALVVEAASSVGMAQQQGYALLIKNSGNSTKFVLYDPSFYREFIASHEGDVSEVQNAPQGVRAFFSAFPGPSDSCEGAVEIGVSSAQKGFGPMMYDVVMSHFSPAPIMADRTSASAAARNIWRFYGGRADVEKIPLNDNDCKTYDDDDALNYAFRAKSPVNFANLVSVHQQFLKELGQSAATFEANLPAAGLEFFDSAVRG